eukprot:2234312-Pyramimonas_sp.AAC.1
MRTLLREKPGPDCQRAGRAAQASTTVPAHRGQPNGADNDPIGRAGDMVEGTHCDMFYSAPQGGYLSFPIPPSNRE